MIIWLDARKRSPSGGGVVSEFVSQASQPTDRPKYVVHNPVDLQLNGRLANH